MPRKSTRGRPASGEYRGKSTVMSFRIRPDTKELLRKTAAWSGRSLSQELEHQAHRALFEMRPGPTHALFTLIASAIDSLVSLKDKNARWTDDPYLFDQAVKATNALLEMYRPKGTVPNEPEETLDHGGANKGALAAILRLRDVQLADVSDPSEQSRYQREMAILRSDLGSLADRPMIFGRTAEETRKQHALGRELAALHRRLSKDRASLSEDEYRHYQNLWQQVQEIQDRADKRRGKKAEGQK